MVTEWARLDTALFWTLVAAFLSSLGWMFKILYDASAFHQTVTSTDFATAILQKKKNNHPLAEIMSVPWWFRVGVYPKRRGAVGMWGSLVPIQFRRAQSCSPAQPFAAWSALMSVMNSLKEGWRDRGGNAFFFSLHRCYILRISLAPAKYFLSAATLSSSRVWWAGDFSLKSWQHQQDLLFISLRSISVCML